MRSTDFSSLRFGLFVHYGLYSLLGRGEWAMNREQIARADCSALSEKFTAEQFDADAICEMAVRAGMRYIVFTTMHHDGFRLYESTLSDFNSMRACGRDLTAEIVEAARRYGLRIGLYHSLNNWMDTPDACDALENPAAYETFIKNTFARLEELVTKFNPVDVLWYDGWWPFNADGWRGEAMNAMVREIQPHILFNGRNGLAGDFSTPEGHLSAPIPWRPWEACISHNDSWGFHSGDEEWKSARQIVAMLATCAQGQGNLLFNIGPRGDGSVPHQSVEALERVGQWLARNGEAIFDTDAFTFDLREQDSADATHRGDWCHFGTMTARDKNLYLLAQRWPGRELVLSGLRCRVEKVSLVGEERDFEWTQQGGKLVVSGLPAQSPDALCPVLRFSCAAAPSIYLCGGMRVPGVPHPHYDPCPSDIAH